MNCDYWLPGFLSSRGICTSADLSATWFTDEVLCDMQQLAAQWVSERASPNAYEECLVAGSGLDLHCDLSCPSPKCRATQVDKLFRHTWHYFDTILLPDGVGQTILHGDLEQHRQHIISLLLDRISVYFLLRDLGALQMVRYFVPTPVSSDWRSDASASGLGNLIEVEEALVHSLSEELTYSQEREGQRITVHVPPSHLGVGVEIGGLEVGLFTAVSEAQQKHDLSEQLVDMSMPLLVRDLLTARRYRAPLGNTVPLHQTTLNMFNRPSSPASIAFHIDLPVVRGIPIERLVQLRRDERDSFERMRAAIRTAAQERLKSAGDSSADAIAGEVERDILNPAISEIRQRLKAVSIAMKKETAFGVSLGALATTCGLVTGVAPPLAAGAGIATAIAAAARAGSRRIGELQDIESSTYYFLWKAVHSN